MPTAAPPQFELSLVDVNGDVCKIRDFHTEEEAIAVWRMIGAGPHSMLSGFIIHNLKTGYEWQGDYITHEC